MYEKEDFLTFFKLPVLLSSFGGLPVPGAEKHLPFSNIFKKLFTFLSVFAIFVMIVTTADKIPVSLYDENFRQWKYFILGGISMLPCCILRNFYMIIRRNEWSGIIKQWDRSFQKPLFPDIRAVELKNEKQFVLKFIKWEYSLMVIPVLLWASSFIITGKQSINSILPWDHTKSPTFGVTVAYHYLYGFFLTATWSANDSFLMIYMSLVAAELRHLIRSLTTILSHLRTTENGVMYTDETMMEGIHYERMEEKYQEKIKEIKTQLNIWIVHHSELIRLEKFYSPLVLLEYLFFIGFCCLMTFYAATGVLPPSYVMVAITLVSSHGVALYVMCWFGERIASLNQMLSEEIFHQDWFLLPKDIQYSVRFIIMGVQRRIGLSAFSIMPLNIKTFEKILKATYSFYMFMRDTNRKASRSLG